MEPVESCPRRRRNLDPGPNPNPRPDTAAHPHPDANAKHNQTQDNIIHGRFLAELTKEVLGDLEASKYQHAEYRISIYGRKQVEQILSCSF